MRCPECLSPDLAIHAYNYATDPQNGYRDEGEMHTCRTCGAESEAGELLPEPMPAKRGVQSETAPATRTKSA